MATSEKSTMGGFEYTFYRGGNDDGNCRNSIASLVPSFTNCFHFTFLREKLTHPAKKEEISQAAVEIAGMCCSGCGKQFTAVEELVFIE